MFVDSPKMFQRILHSIWSEGRSGRQPVHWRCSSPFLDHTDWIIQWTLRWPHVGHGWWLLEMDGTTTHCRSSGSVTDSVIFVNENENGEKW